MSNNMTLNEISETYENLPSARIRFHRPTLCGEGRKLRPKKVAPNGRIYIPRSIHHIYKSDLLYSSRRDFFDSTLLYTYQCDINEQIRFHRKRKGSDDTVWKENFGFLNTKFDDMHCSPSLVYTSYYQP